MRPAPVLLTLLALADPAAPVDPPALPGSFLYVLQDLEPGAAAAAGTDWIVTDPRHPPPGGPRGEIVGPAPDAVVTAPPLLEWEAGDGAGRFLLTFTGDASFRRTVALPRRGLLAGDSCLPGEREFRRIARLAARNPAGRVWFRVTAEDAGGRRRTSRAACFRVGSS